MGYNFFAWVER